MLSLLSLKRKVRQRMPARVHHLVSEMPSVLPGFLLDGQQFLCRAYGPIRWADNIACRVEAIVRPPELGNQVEGDIRCLPGLWMEVWPIPPGIRGRTLHCHTRPCSKGELQDDQLQESISQVQVSPALLL